MIGSCRNELSLHPTWGLMNFDEFAMFVEAVPAKTVAPVGAAVVRGATGNFKKRITVISFYS